MPHARDDTQLVISFFENAAAADVASRVLEEDARLRGHAGAVGVLVLDREGRVDGAKLGDRSTSGRLAVGAVLATIARALSGELSFDLGYVFDDASDLSATDIARFGAELDAGGAAVVVLDRHDDADDAVITLTGLGGKTEMHALSTEAIRLAAEPPPSASGETTR